MVNVKQRKQLEQESLDEVHGMLQNAQRQRLLLKKKGKVYKSCLRSAILHGNQTCSAVACSVHEHPKNVLFLPIFSES